MDMPMPSPDILQPNKAVTSCSRDKKEPTELSAVNQSRLSNFTPASGIHTRTISQEKHDQKSVCSENETIKYDEVIKPTESAIHETMHSTAHGPVYASGGHAQPTYYGARYQFDDVITPPETAHGTISSVGHGTLQTRYFHDEGFAKNYMSATVGNGHD